MQDFDIVDYGNRLANNKRLMILVAKEFLKESAMLVQQLLDYVAAEDWGNVARIAHRIKGASAEVSGFAMSISAKKIEQALQDGDITSAQVGLAQLQLDYTALQKVLSAHDF